MFIGEKVVCISYVYDLLFLTHGETNIHDLAIIHLKQEDDATGFLGKIRKQNEFNLLELDQEDLINHENEALGLDVGILNEKTTPS